MDPLKHFMTTKGLGKTGRKKVKKLLYADSFSNNNIGSTLKGVFAPIPKVAQERRSTLIQAVTKPITTTRSDMVGSTRLVGMAKPITGATVRKFEVTPTPTPKVIRRTEGSTILVPYHKVMPAPRPQPSRPMPAPVPKPKLPPNPGLRPTPPKRKAGEWLIRPL